MSEDGGGYPESSSSATCTAENLVSLATGHGQNYFILTNDEDQNSVASEMPATLTVTYAVIAPCVIATCTALKPVQSGIQVDRSSGPLAGLSSLAANRTRGGSLSWTGPR